MPIDPSQINTIRVGQLPPGVITATSKIAVEADDENLYQISGQDLIDFINTNANAFQFETKDLYVDQAYIDTNFDPTGLGIGIMTGWAIVNGNNETPPGDGLVHINYGTNYNVVGGVGGSKDAVVVKHTHNVVVAGNAGGSGNVSFNDGPGTGKTYATSETGVDGANKNMQPYRVVLRIMKL